jgi:hypothetical protein
MRVGSSMADRANCRYLAALCLGPSCSVSEWLLAMKLLELDLELQFSIAEALQGRDPEDRFGGATEMLSDYPDPAWVSAPEWWLHIVQNYGHLLLGLPVESNPPSLAFTPSKPV